MKENLGSAEPCTELKDPSHLKPDGRATQIKSNLICSDLDSTSWRQTLIQCNVFQINYPLGYLKRLFRKLLIGSIVSSSAVQYSKDHISDEMSKPRVLYHVTLLVPAAEWDMIRRLWKNPLVGPHMPHQTCSLHNSNQEGRPRKEKDQSPCICQVQ